MIGLILHPVPLAKGSYAACHLVEGRLVGPSFGDIARKHGGDPEAPTRLAQKVVTGGGGVWSPLAMPPNALISEAEAAVIVKYVLSLADTNSARLAHRLQVSSFTFIHSISSSPSCGPRPELVSK